MEKDVLSLSFRFYHDRLLSETVQTTTFWQNMKSLQETYFGL